MDIARAPLVLTLFLVMTSPLLVSAQTDPGPYDILITGGRIVDGTGNPWFSGDVAIRDDRIVAVGHLAEADATRVIDATGLVVAPGFIDLHTHSDGRLLDDGTAQSKVRQGVTLDVAGESSSQGPRDGLDTDGGGAGWTTFTGYFERLEEQGISMNLITHVSYHQVRRVVKGFDESPATPAELERMKELTARSMEEGAWGLVTRFGSGGPRHSDEVLELARVVASYGGNYTSHHGSEGYEQEQEIDFAIRVAEETGIPVHLFHFKIRARNNWGTIDRFIDQIARARARGLDITSRPTVKSYIESLEIAHAIHLLRPFRGGGGGEIVSRPKCYAFDTGFVTFEKGWTRIREDDRGLLWEHLVLDSLRFRHLDEDIFYWRDKAGREVDFVVRRRERRLDTFECKIDPDEVEPRAVNAFRRRYPEGRDYVVVPVVKGPYRMRRGGREFTVCGTRQLPGSGGGVDGLH